MIAPASSQPSGSFLRLVTDNLSVFSGARFAFVRVDHEINGAIRHTFGHERLFQPCWETCTATTAQTRLLDLLNQPVTPLPDAPSSRVNRHGDEPLIGANRHRRRDW